MGKPLVGSGVSPNVRFLKSKHRFDCDAFGFDGVYFDEVGLQWSRQVPGSVDRVLLYGPADCSIERSGRPVVRHIRLN